MSIAEQEMKEMVNRAEKCTNFLRNTSMPAKIESRKIVEKYFDDFIKFPGSLSIASAFLLSSELVQNHSFAICGMFLIVGSLLVALNVSKSLAKSAFCEYEKMALVEQPMVIFSAKLTQFSRSELSEDELRKSYKNLDDSYTESILLLEKNDANLNFIRYSVDVSFYALLFGVLLCVLSVVCK